MRSDALAIWQRLTAAGIVTGDAPADAVTPPWYVRTMLGFAGWIGALFLCVVVGGMLFSTFDKHEEATFVGVLLCGAAWFLFVRHSTNEFAVQFGLAVSMAGQGMMGYGLIELFDGNDTHRFLAVAVAEATVALLLPNIINRFLAAVAAMLFLGLALADNGALTLAPALATAGFALLSLHEFRFAKYGATVRPVAYGLVVSAIAFNLDGLWSVSHMLGYADVDEHTLLLLHRAGLLLQAATLLLVAWRLLVRENAHQTTLTATLTLTLLVAVLLKPAPGVITALVAVVLGFANGNRLLRGLGLVGAIGYLGSYYYQWDVSLLEKAEVLCAAGAVLLMARALFLRLWPGQAATGEEHA